MSTGLSSSSKTERIFSCPPFVYDEVYGADGTPRAHWARFLTALRSVPAAEFANRNEQADRMLRENGVSYHTASSRGDDARGDSARPWRMDLLPMLITAADWAAVAEGLAQRARLLNLVIADVYGPRTLIDDGILPPEILYANPEFLRPFCDIGRLDQVPMLMYGAELARSVEGQWWVMADRSEAPAGPGFALENRIVTSRSMP
jgi:uncharacterized circularly permuted ATP-grasp superfamily protein